MSPVDLSHDGPLAVITLDAPPLNLFDEPLVRALQDAIAAVRSSADTRGLLIRANGRAVSAGVDVKLFATLDPVSGAALWREWLAMIQSVESLPYPTVFAAHALCLTAAFELSLACDILLAAESATFGLVEIVVGLTPSMGGPQRLAERAGPARARELIYTGELYDAATLERWNVVNRVLPDEGFMDAALELARELAAGPPLAHAATKQVIREYLDGGLEHANERVSEIAGGLFDTEDLRGAVRSFLEEGPGKARFAGR
jgi:enoyl-CoA hydratase/carnithine racemase